MDDFRTGQGRPSAFKTDAAPAKYDPLCGRLGRAARGGKRLAAL